MPLYHKCLVSECGNCAYFRRHYILVSDTRFEPLRYGHCVFPRLKDREVTQTCAHWKGKDG